MQILGIKIDGIRLLKAVQMEFSPEAGLVQIKGKNRQGKTSVLDTFELMFRGMKKRREDMITHGRDRADITVELSEGYTIKRTLLNGRDTVEIRKDGKKYTDMTPQAFLDTLVNDLTFNPRPFIDKKSEEKLSFLMQLLKIDFSEIDKKIKEYEDERLLIGREVRAFGEIQPVEPMEEIDIEEVLRQKHAITESNNRKLAEANEKIKQETAIVDDFNNQQRKKASDIENTKSTLEQLKSEVNQCNTDIAELEIKLAQLKEKRAATEARIEKGNEYLAGLPAPAPLKSYPTLDNVELESTDSLDQELARATEVNKLAMKYKEYLSRVAAKENKEREYHAATARIEAERDKKKAILAGVKMPINGLEIKEVEGKDNVWGVYYNGIHSENWSDSEAITISSNLCLAMKPELSAIFIDRGECYDEDSLKALETWAKENNIQTFITIVDSIPDELEDGVFYVQDGVVVKGGE